MPPALVAPERRRFRRGPSRRRASSRRRDTRTDLLISAAQLLTGPPGERIDDGAVLVRDGQIAAVGPRDQLEKLTTWSTRRADHRNGTLLPGLIDCHAHLPSDPADRARLHLAAGVTTVRHLGDPPTDIPDAGPRIMTGTGVDLIEHCALEPVNDLTYPDDLIDGIARANTAVSPAIHRGWTQLDEDELDRSLAAIARLRKQGVRLIYGSDAGTPGSHFGDAAEGLSLLGLAGLPHAEVIAAATTYAAQACGIGDLTGQLTPGHRADLLVVGGDPLTDLAALRDIHMVVADGRTALTRAHR